MKNLKKMMLLSALFFVLHSAIGQNRNSLSIGDDAPEIKYSKWIKGIPISTYEKDRFYVVEFWATWCGPCKAAMPHLSTLAKKYKDNATFIGVNIWEKTGDKPYESSLPAVTQFVKSMGSDMDYNVVVDNNDHFMVNNWMVPASQMGIPSTFLIKDRKIIWIGHPMKVDSIIMAEMNGKYDIQIAMQQFELAKAKNEALKAKFAILTPIEKAISSKDYQKATTLLSSLDQYDPDIKLQKNYFTLIILLAQKKEDEAIAFGNEWLKDNSTYGSIVATELLKTDGLSKKAYLYSAELNKKRLNLSGTITPLVYSEIAAAYQKAGENQIAIDMQELAVKEAENAFKAKKYIGSITNETILNFKDTLLRYNGKLQ
ncbi:TlpA family protein disulfide reductase [Sphingobacterium athyrii]|uniref:Thioredoxin domain-containing protein n=1 Tax=Sphingobacterium athyrii TaxID=2152717 RepID=A0A363NUQ1_9SPHI|nr:redoxin domain-containing protein [Sphingobacterium athyrii]PUV24509.1 hypothetical protein DCO56_14295 [Sphingobacterium athyrii]